MNTGSRKAFMKRSLEALSVLLLFAGVILSRLYLFDIYKVPSYSMEPTLLAGDFILVSKAEYGPRVISFSKLLLKRELVYRWHRGSRKPRLDDLIVFNQPVNATENCNVSSTFGQVMVKRITGLPGDSVRIYRPGTGRACADVFPFDTALHWRADHYGPLYVPQKNDTLDLTEENLSHFELVILAENLFRPGDARLFPVQPTHHVFRMDYYFVTGDNFYMSSDSRHWGFVPETHIIGKVTRILFSRDKSSAWKSRIRWERILKKVN
ncbi:MAG: signal peptidase I [Bacteroidales bacterium]